MLFILGGCRVKWQEHYFDELLQSTLHFLVLNSHLEILGSYLFLLQQQAWLKYTACFNRLLLLVFFLSWEWKNRVLDNSTEPWHHALFSTLFKSNKTTHSSNGNRFFTWQSSSWSTNILFYSPEQLFLIPSGYKGHSNTMCTCTKWQIKANSLLQGNWVSQLVRAGNLWVF